MAGTPRHIRCTDLTRTASGACALPWHQGSTGTCSWSMASAGSPIPARRRLKTMGSGGKTAFCSMAVETLRCNASVSGASKEQGSTGCKVSIDPKLESDPVDERAIIARCLAGDRRAYGVLVERYKVLV